MAEFQCPYDDIKNPAINCTYKSTSKAMIGHHIASKHTKAPKEEVKNENKEETKTSKKSNRMESKPPKFTENETREDFRRKQGEFKSYVERAEISGEEEADDHYRSCDTPLKRKLIMSNKISEIPKKTKPGVMLEEIERICLPKVNVIMERQQFCRLE